MWLQNFDWSVLYWMQDNIRAAWLDGFMSVFTLLGEAGIIWIVCAAALLFFRKHRRTGVLTLLGLLLGVIVCNLLLKNIVARPRPFMLDPSVVLAVAPPSEWSFPSGHASSAAAAAAVLMLGNRRLGIPACAVGLLMCFSRMYLFVHFPTDILGGILVGACLGCAAYFGGGRLYDKIERRLTERRAVNKSE